MDRTLKADLKRFGQMAFVRAADCTGLIEAFHRLGARARRHPDFGLLEKVYAWVFVPLTVWPVDVRGLGLLLVERVAKGRPVGQEARLLCAFLPEAPPEETCNAIIEYEHSVKTGNYDELISAQYKFDSMEKELSENPEFRADWGRVKQEFNVNKYRNPRGVIRRRMVQERNFRPPDWNFAWKTEAQRFQLVFDAFCNRWDLYGVEGDRPLLLKLSVNLTPFSTMIEVPRYWSFDPKRDLKWNAITKLHRMRGVQRQGPKLSPGRVERLDEAERARQLWERATRAGLKGETRDEWIRERLRWDERTDESKLRRRLSEE
jgi:hypothetical protein